MKTAISERNTLNRRWQRCTQNDQKRLLKSQINEANGKIKTIVNQERNASAISELNVNNKIEFTNIGKAYALANAFEVAHNLTLDQISPLEHKVNQCIHQLDTIISYNIPADALISNSEITETLRKFKNAKAPGIDGITNLQHRCARGKRWGRSTVHQLKRVTNFINRSKSHR